MVVLRTFVLLLLVGTATLSNDRAVASDAIVQWQMHTLQLELASVPSDPHDIELEAIWSHPSGDTQVTPGFWNGSHYEVRFCPELAGRWKYQTKSSVSDLNLRSGTIQVEAAPADAQGSVVIDPERPTRLAYSSGDEYFPIAIECDWLFALDANNPDDIPKTRMLVDTLAASGFNQLVLNVFAFDVNWKKDPSLTQELDYGSPSVFPFGGHNGAPQHEELNIEYFERFDRVIEYLHQKGIVAHLMIYVWNKQVNWPAANSKEDNRYFDYVVKRYQAYPNIIWDISKEALGYGHNDVDYITERIARLRRLDGHGRLVTVHDYGYCRKFPKQVDFVSVQLWSSELYGVMRKTVENFPGKPILNIEHGGYERGPFVVFEGEYTSPETCLERAYQCVFAGTYPTHYWQGAAWNVVIHDVGSLPAAQKPKLHYYRHLSDLIAEHDFDGLTAGKKHSNSGFCLTNESNRFVFFVPKENEKINLRLPAKHRGRTMEAVWYNPYTGDYSEPIQREVVQWPAFYTPTRDGFSVLLITILPE